MSRASRDLSFNSLSRTFAPLENETLEFGSVWIPPVARPRMIPQPFGASRKDDAKNSEHDGASPVKIFIGGLPKDTSMVECRIAAIQAIQVAEVHNMLARLRMLRSYLSKEQLQTPALKFFQENLPNLSVVRNEEDKVFELRPNEKNFRGNERASVVSAAGGQQFSVESVKHSFLDAAGLQIPDFVLDGALDTQMSQMLGVGDAFQTPGSRSNRSSFGTTPKTSRPPMQGEMLLSVRGSPLGVYKEDHLEAIHESGDGSHADSSG